MSKKKKPEPQVVIKYRNGGLNNQYVFWDLFKADGITRLPVSDGGWNGLQNNKRQAEKEAEHYARMAEQKLAQKK